MPLDIKIKHKELLWMELKFLFFVPYKFKYLNQGHREFVEKKNSYICDQYYRGMLCLKLEPLLLNISRVHLYKLFNCIHDECMGTI